MAMNMGPGWRDVMLRIYPEYGPYLALRADGMEPDEALGAARWLVEHWREQDEADASTSP